MLIHIDTDIGGDPDDLCALAMVLGWPGAELTGVTTVGDPLGARAGLAAFALNAAGHSEVPVAAGAGGFTRRRGTDPGPTDASLLWPESVHAIPSPPGEALNLLSASIERGATVVAIGPFTNLALLEVMRPGLLRTVQVVVMGGYTGPPPEGFPSWGPNMDWNVQYDPEAARIVFDRCDPVVVPLAVTVQTVLRERDIDPLKEGNPLSKLIASQALLWEAKHGNRKLGMTHDGLPDDLLNFQHDPLACAVALGWDGAKVERRSVRPELVDRILTLEPDASSRGMKIVTSVDQERFRAVWLEATTTPAPHTSR